MKATAILALGALALVGMLMQPAQAQNGNAPTEIDMIQLNEDMYVITNVAVPGLVTVLVTDDGVLLVDDKFETDHDNILGSRDAARSSCRRGRWLRCRKQ